MRFFSAPVLSLVIVSLAACAPSTTYNRGIDMSFHPSANANAQSRVVSSAVELKTEADTTLVKDAGGMYLGELEVVGEKAGAIFMGKGGAETLSGRISLEAASRGATHFFLSSSRIENGVETHANRGGRATYIPTAKTHARFVLFRLEPAAWEKVPQAYRPSTATAVSGDASASLPPAGSAQKL